MSVVRQVGYQPASARIGPIEVLTFGSLRRRWGHEPPPTLRGDFFVLALVEAGRGTVDVDFDSHRVGVRTVALVRPGAVHRWTDIAGLTGGLVLFTPSAPTAQAHAAVSGFHVENVWRPAAATVALAVTGLTQLRRELDAADDRSPATARLLLSALLLRLAPPTSVTGPTSDVIERFRRRVERDFRRHHDVAHYATHLGYSARTLTRAVHAATGQSAKAYLTARLVLEAQRLLVHDGLSAARCAARLGFDDPSNFSAWFLRETGERPGRWREIH